MPAAILWIITGELRVIKHFIVAICAILLSACSDKEAPSNSLIVGTSADNPPYEFIQDGKIVGLDIDVIKAIGSSLGKEVVIKNLDFPGLFPSLGGGNVDLVIAGLSYTPARAEYFAFSKPYASSSMAIMSRKDDNIKSINGLKGKSIGAQLGTTWDQEAKNITTTIPGSTVRSLSNNLVLVEELKFGSVDAMVLEEMQAEKFINNNPMLTSFRLPEATSKFVIAFHKDSKWPEEVNKAIDELEKSGKLLEIKKRWMDK
jgi:ABC-type amino acid transport substrate-binding protein